MNKMWDKGRLGWGCWEEGPLGFEPQPALEADLAEPQEGSFGDTFRKAPQGCWRKACGPTHFPAPAKVRQIIESLFLGSRLSVHRLP